MKKNTILFLEHHMCHDFKKIVVVQAKGIPMVT